MVTKNFDFSMCKPRNGLLIVVIVLLLNLVKRMFWFAISLEQKVSDNRIVVFNHAVAFS